MHDLPNNVHELSAFYLRTGMTVFEYIGYHILDEEPKHNWIVNSKDWAIKKVTLKALSPDDLPVLVIHYKYRAVIHNKVILASFRTNWAREIIFEAFGLTGTQAEIHQQSYGHKNGVIIFEN